ncbi:AraC family transcriptional regulator [Nonomuraea sp. MCN248]|uniref:AraC family transcriptional regulator n=1 Tax=Nonomuraea corallina TaxID=2989783 RepID=A0ABT4S709_9ACTN|nr:AraC family transcriptional regulator [Nonomuraea corallina]MDA0632838.1 AraC family transcriptional regulator [Nonomuraea corallina]
MDVLSDVIAGMRIGLPHSVRVAWSAPWGQRFPAMQGSAGFQVILQGSCWLLPDAGEPIQLHVGDVLFVPHGHGYALADSPSTDLADSHCEPDREAGLFASASAGGSGAVTVTLSGGYRLDQTRGHPILRELPDLIHLPARLGQQRELRAAVDLLAAEIADPKLGADTVVASLLDTLLLYILRAYLDLDSGRCAIGRWAAALADPGISAALEAVHGDPAHPWTVASLADLAGLSRAAFARRFALLVGRPPLGYLTWWRLSTASRLLRTTDAPLSEVAHRVGYGSEYAFANAFKREFGTPPGRFRRQTCSLAPAPAG